MLYFQESGNCFFTIAKNTIFIIIMTGAASLAKLVVASEPPWRRFGVIGFVIRVTLVSSSTAPGHGRGMCWTSARSATATWCSAVTRRPGTRWRVVPRKPTPRVAHCHCRFKGSLSTVRKKNNNMNNQMKESRIDSLKEIDRCLRDVKGRSRRRSHVPRLFANETLIFESLEKRFLTFSGREVDLQSTSAQRRAAHLLHGRLSATDLLEEDQSLTSFFVY